MGFPGTLFEDPDLRWWKASHFDLRHTVFRHAQQRWANAGRSSRNCSGSSSVWNVRLIIICDI
jgi:hypothetical protein